MTAKIIKLEVDNCPFCGESFKIAETHEAYYPVHDNPDCILYRTLSDESGIIYYNQSQLVRELNQRPGDKK